MINSTLTKLPKETVELTITISPERIKIAYEKILKEVIETAEIKGFRKGKAPKEVVLKTLDKKRIYEEVIKEVLPESYSESLKQHDLHPISDPQVSLVSPQDLAELEKGVELILKARTAQRPIIVLKNYQEEIKKLKATKSIWVPGKGEPEKADNKEKELSLEEIIKVLLDNTEAEISDFLIEQEANRLLGQTLDEIKKLGLTLDQYLSSTKKTVETLKSEASQKALNDLKLEFVLGEVAKTEKIVVSQEDLEKVITENKDPKAQENLRSQSYMLAAILLQQKTLDFLKNL